MEIVVTAGQINDHGDWHAFCELKGIGEWAMNEGRLDSSEKFTFTVEEIVKIGMSGFLIRRLSEYGVVGPGWPTWR